MGNTLIIIRALAEEATTKAVLDLGIALMAIISAFMIGLIIGGSIIFFAKYFVFNRSLSKAQTDANKSIEATKLEAKQYLIDARAEASKIRAEAEAESRERRNEMTKLETRLTQRAEVLENKIDSLDDRERNLNKRDKEIEEGLNRIEELKKEEMKKMEMIAGMTTEAAKASLLEIMEGELSEEYAIRMRQWEEQVRQGADEKARDILVQTIQRNASDLVSETTVSTVSLPSDEMKGRLIGREGRNIKALEQATGVELIIDDTPEAVTLSAFDPVRREIARQTLNKLVTDGRIHPARIEELAAKAKEEVEATIAAAGEQAAYQSGVHGLRSEVIKTLGRLKYRTSYGQNVLNHSIEVARLAGMIASELKLNVAIAKRAGLLHDIGKAMDHNIEGTHAQIGADFIKHHEKSPEVIAGIAEHHFETGNTSIWGFLTSAADAISSARPGARRESLENYLKRLRDLEEIADNFSGVEKSYAIQAGREIRILVKPEEIDDLAAMRLAREIVQKIEETLEYPGQIKVTVLRETRVVDYAK